MIRNSQHWIDVPLGKKRQRTISNWLNFREPGGKWRFSSPGVRLAQGTPPNWPGAFDFSYHSLEAPLQCFLRDASDVGNRAMVGVRVAARPDSWLNLKALDGAAVDTVVEGASVRWPELWKNSDLVYTPGRHKLVKEIVCHASGHPTTFAFSMRLAPGHTLAFVGGGARVLDDDGAEVLRLNPPWAHDASTVYQTPEGHKSIGVTLREGEPRVIGGRSHQVIELMVSEEDLEGAVYPVTIDPTVTISGTTDIEDSCLVLAGFNNYGGSTTLYLASSDSYRGVIRIIPSSIPAGSITGFRLAVYVSSSGQEFTAYFIKDANDWVEGTSTSGSQEGSVCWAQCKYLEQDWAGSGGCGTSGVDYDTDSDPPKHTPGASGWTSFTLDPAWPPLWRDAARAANGMRFSSPGAYSGWRSSEHSTDPLYFEVDYEEAPAGGTNKAFFFLGGM